MSTENSFDPDSIASRIVAFLASLQGMDEYRPAPATAAIDLMSGTIVWPDVHFPHGEKLKVQFAPAASNAAVAVHTYKLVDTFLVRHARMLAVMEGGRVDQHYEQIKEHFSIKTGFGLE